MRARTVTRARALYLELAALGCAFEVYREPDGPLGLSGAVHFPPGLDVSPELEERIHKSGNALLAEVLLHGFSGKVRDEEVWAIREEANVVDLSEEWEED